MIGDRYSLNNKDKHVCSIIIMSKFAISISHFLCPLLRATLNIEGRVPRAKLFASSRKRKDGTFINEHCHNTIVSFITSISNLI